MAKINADDKYFLCIGFIISHTAEYLQYLHHFGSTLLCIKSIISSMTSKHASITTLYDKIGWNIDFHGLINFWSHALLSLWVWVKKASASHWVWCWRFLKRLITGDALFRGGFSSLLKMWLHKVMGSRDKALIWSDAMPQTLSKHFLDCHTLKLKKTVKKSSL